MRENLSNKEMSSYFWKLINTNKTYEWTGLIPVISDNCDLSWNNILIEIPKNLARITGFAEADFKVNYLSNPVMTWHERDDEEMSELLGFYYEHPDGEHHGIYNQNHLKIIRSVIVSLSNGIIFPFTIRIDAVRGIKEEIIVLKMSLIFGEEHTGHFLGIN